jgi:membrane-bound lytic murein transglycosylase B
VIPSQIISAHAKFITRYNWSSYYAMAVIELGQAVAQEMEGKP